MVSEEQQEYLDMENEKQREDEAIASLEREQEKRSYE